MSELVKQVHREALLKKNISNKRDKANKRKKKILNLFIYLQKMRLTIVN